MALGPILTTTMLSSTRSRFVTAAVLVLAVVLIGVLRTQTSSRAAEAESSRQWLAGDHHIHTRFSVGWDRETDPPAPVVGGDAIYPIPMNAVMARYYGLAWMVTTDHGGPLHDVRASFGGCCDEHAPRRAPRAA